MSTTVENILAARPSLRERAKQAADKAAAKRSEEYTAMSEALIDETMSLLRDEYGSSDSELYDVEFDVLPYQQNNKTTPSIVFVIDGIKLRSRYTRVKVMTTTSAQFDNEDVYVDAVQLEVFRANAWRQVKDLASLGEALH